MFGDSSPASRLIGKAWEIILAQAIAQQEARAVGLQSLDELADLIKANNSAALLGAARSTAMRWRRHERQESRRAFLDDVLTLLSEPATLDDEGRRPVGHQRSFERQHPMDGGGRTSRAEQGARLAEDDAIAALVGHTVVQVEHDLILRTLDQTGGNRTRAATILGISLRTLRNKLHQYADQGDQHEDVGANRQAARPVS